MSNVFLFTLSLLICIIGLILWFVPFKNPKINEAGRTAYAIGLALFLYHADVVLHHL